MRLVIDAETRGARDLLAGMLDRVREPRAMGALLADALVDYVQGTFATSGHGTWAHLDPVTVRAKASGRILVDTGHLLANLLNVKVHGDVALSVPGDATYAVHLKAFGRDPLPPPSSQATGEIAGDLLRYIRSGRR